MFKGVKVGDKFRVTIYDTLTGEAILLEKRFNSARIKVLDYVSCYSCQGPLINDEITVTKKDIADYVTPKGRFHKYKEYNLLKRVLTKRFTQKRDFPF